MTFVWKRFAKGFEQWVVVAKSATLARKGLNEGGLYNWRAEFNGAEPIGEFCGDLLLETESEDKAIMHAVTCQCC